jgi:hypothetical protein
MSNDVSLGSLGRFRGLILAGVLVFAAGCGANAQRGAAEGAATGAMAGAVGGMFTAMIFGGNVAEAGARGAAYGGSSGAVVGAMAGSRADQAEADERKAQREAELKKLRDEIGADAYNGLLALGECKHEIALANGREAAKSSNRGFALAGTWVQALTEADRQNDAGARALFPEIVSRDKQVASDADAQEHLGIMLNKLQQIRVEYNKPASCKT